MQNVELKTNLRSLLANACINMMFTGIDFAFSG